MAERAPDAEDLSVVILGSLNPGIFHPEWFRRQEILRPQESEEAKITAVSPQGTEIKFLDMQLDVIPDRIVLSTTDVSRAEKLQDVLLNVIAKLPHTPMTACGLNNTIQFDLGDENYWHEIGHALAPKDAVWNHVLQNPGMASLEIKGVREGEFPGAINITVAPSKKFSHGLLISSNFHYPVPRNADGTAQSEKVPRYLEEMWKPALAKAREVAYRIFDQVKPTR